MWVRRRAQSLAVGHPQFVVDILHVRGIPSYRDEAHGSTAAWRRHVEECNTVVIGIGDGQLSAMLQQAQSVGGAAWKRLTEKSCVEGFLHPPLPQVHHRDTVVIGIGHKQSTVSLVQTHLVGVTSHGDRIGPRLRCHVPNLHLVASPAGGVSVLAIC